MVTDIDGYQEDLKAGVRTIYTGLGIRRGLYAVAGLVFFGSLTTLLLLHRPVDLLVLPALGTMAAIALLRFKRSRPVMLLAAMGLVYAAASYLGWF
jgi:4-hydroxybenzoate polyprenyltransferase